MGNGEGGIRTLGTLLGYGALAKRCFRPLSHLTKIDRARIWRRIAECQLLIASCSGAENTQQVLDTSASISRLLSSDQREGGTRENSIGSFTIASN